MSTTRIPVVVVLLVIVLATGPGIRSQSPSVVGAGPVPTSPAGALAGACRVDFGFTPDDFGFTSGCPGPTPLKNQFTFSQKIVFGSGVSFPGGSVPPAVIRSDLRCVPPCRSAGSPTFTTDWWCEFRIGTAPGIPGDSRGVNGFSAEICFVDNLSNPHPLLIAYDVTGAIVATAQVNPLGGPVQTLTVTDPLMSNRIRFIQVDSSGDLGGLTVDCLNYDDPGHPPACPPGGGGSGNGTNYHVLSNGMDVIYAGIGAGGTQARSDGLGTWIAGENMRGSHITVTGDFGYRNRAWREVVCPIKNPSSGTLQIWFRGLFFIELDGLNANNQTVFLDPSCPLPGPSFPLGTSGFIPYGTGSNAFVLLGIPAGLGPAPSTAILAPNNGLVPSSAGGQAVLLGALSNMSIPIASSGFCWGVHFAWIPSPLAFDDNIDGFWHYAMNSPDNNQYWGMSNDEMNIWQSNSVLSDGGLTAAIQFPPNLDYELLMASVEPNTTAALAPRGFNLAGPYYAQTENVANEFGVSLNLNGGFDVGRGSAAISLTGTAGVPSPITGLGNQNAANNPGTLTTLGFVTWDNGGDGDGSYRLTWLSIDFLGLQRINPDLDPGITKLGGQIRVPVVSAGFLQPITNTFLALFQHLTKVPPSGVWPDPGGFPGVAPFGVQSVAGASWQLPVGPLPAACVGTKLNLTYGTSGRAGCLESGPAGLTFNPEVADTSGTKQLFLFD